ncbi:MAG: tRNA uridine-5-carboxymethylaminomethyl(34) synthesis GTPase MnmE [Thermodesulfobacteriota bacterium]
MDTATIGAIATPFGYGGIGIIRISGPKAFPFGASIFRRRNHAGNPVPGLDETIFPFESHKLYYGLCIDPQTVRVIDEILITFMRSPATYTREDVVEIHAHGGPCVLQSIMEIALQAGIRPAEPGEFTKRAFLNGRIDLTQAEAVIDVISATSQNALQLAAAQMQGQVRSAVEKIRDQLLALQTTTEAIIDFPEETDEIPLLTQTQRRQLSRIVADLSDLIQQYHQYHFFREGIRITIVGAPNVGKSSLMNRLLQKERAIVTDIPGTTRDLIEDSFLVEGIPIIITDTAGIQNTNDPIEQIGIMRARQQVSTADLVLFVTDAQRPLGFDGERHFLESLQDQKAVIVINKIDLVPALLPLAMPPGSSIPVVGVSALTGAGIDELKRLMLPACLKERPETDHPFAPNQRHAAALLNCRDACNAILSQDPSSLEPELVAVDLRDAIRHIDGILGVQIENDILDRIFSNFCIGK